MKAAQRFMRPVKEIREGFSVVDDNEQGLISSAASMSGTFQPHAVSATRHYAEQYRSRAIGAGILPSRSLSTSPRSSRAVSPRKSLTASMVASATAGDHDASHAFSSTGLSERMQSTGLQGAASLSHRQPV